MIEHSSWWQRGGALFAGIIAAAALAGAEIAGAPRAAAAPGESDKTMEGFPADAAATEAQLEQRFDADLSAAEQADWMKTLTAAPNHVGSPHDKANAEFILQKFREWGWDASIETFSVLYPTPREVSLELVAPTHFTALLREPPLAGDETSVQTAEELPAYNAYGADGDIEGELIYVNQGMPDDYTELEREGLSVKGRIVLVRYGGGWRGLKLKLAYEHGAIGCLIYSDPRDDGYGEGDVYPGGGYRPADGVQRGSVQDIVIYSGDPLTPGVGATPGAKRLALKDARTILKIPVLPISYAAAAPLLTALGGRVAPEQWRGGLPLTYHIGPGPARVHMKVASDWSQKTLYDVIARMQGSAEPDRWVIRGNHHDAWVFGASDPMSGTVALLSEAKSIGRLAQQGWRPRRTLIYASWDGEEPGLIGSTEWVETHAAELKQKAALYVNSDVNTRGFLQVGGTRSLQHFASEIARDVKDPLTGASVLARSAAAERAEAYESGHAAAPADAELKLRALGSGSDYTPFLQHLGVSSVDVSFGGEASYGVYHSAYDSYDHFRRFVDPGFKYGVALAKVAGRMMLRAADADILPARTADFADSIAGYSEELHKLSDDMRTKTRDLTALLDDGVFTLAADPLLERAAPQREAAVPYLQLSILDNAVEQLKISAKAFDLAYAQAVSAGGPGAPARRERMNVALTGLEETLTDSRGLPTREWYQHMIYAPGMKTGYVAKTLPGIREAIEERRWDEANRYIGVVAATLDAYRAALDRAIAEP